MKHESDITIVLDRSGSMEAIASDAVGGFNQFLAAQQREPGACRLTLVQFDHEYDVVYARVPIAEAPQLAAAAFVPRGTTALLDAIGRTIDAAGDRLQALPEAERPDRVLVVIITDGLENASRDYTRERIFQMIATQRDVYNWTFLFLAANQDAIAAGRNVGIDQDHSLAWAATADGVRAASAAMSKAVSAFRSTGDVYGTRPPRKRKPVH